MNESHTAIALKLTASFTRLILYTNTFFSSSLCMPRSPHSWRRYSASRYVSRWHTWSSRTHLSRFQLDKGGAGIWTQEVPKIDISSRIPASWLSFLSMGECCCPDLGSGQSSFKSHWPLFLLRAFYVSMDLEDNISLIQHKLVLRPRTKTMSQILHSNRH